MRTVVNIAILIAIHVAFVVASSGSVLAEGLDMARVEELKVEGKKHFDASADVDLPFSDRNKERKAAYDLLTEAFEILDKWCEAHPEDAERLEDLMVEIHHMRYWLRKESPVGLLEGKQSPHERRVPDDWPAKPPDDLHEPALPPGQTKPPPEAAPTPAPERPDPVVEHLARTEEYAKRHPYDIAGIRDLYLDIAEHAAPGSAGYETALKRAAELSARLKDAYRVLRGADPDTLDLAGAEERRLVHSLSGDLKSKEEDVRLRAAQYLGLLGSGEAARHLVNTWKTEKVEAVVDQIVGALSKIGGAKVAAELEKVAAIKKEPMQMDALAILATLSGRSKVEGRYASLATGKFVTSKFDPVATEAIANLEAMGPDGVYGLVEAVEARDPSVRLRVIEALGRTGDGRAAGGLGPFLVFGAKGGLRQLREAAIEALKRIGKPAVPHLARFMGNPQLRQFTGFVLREITGVNFEYESQVRAWWSQHGSD